jgi:hypothetical protein
VGRTRWNRELSLAWRGGRWYECASRKKGVKGCVCVFVHVRVHVRVRVCVCVCGGGGFITTCTVAGDTR